MIKVIRDIIVTVLILGLPLLSGVWWKSNQEVKRLREDKAALQEGITLFKTRDSLNAASVLRIKQERDEFKQYNAGLNQTVESLNIKLKRLQSASQTAVETKYEVKVQIKDSIVIRDSVPELIKCLSYKDAWIDIEGCFGIDDTTFSPLIVSRDTIKQFVDRVPRQFWFIKYGTKGIRQTIVTSNPYSKPVYTEYIELKR